MLMKPIPAIEAHALSHAYGEHERRRSVLEAVSLDVAQAEIVFLRGPSGCGKTTLLTLIGALRGVQSGRLKVLGTELLGADQHTLVGLRRRIGFVFQHHNLHRSLSALENVRMGLEARGERPDAAVDRRCAAMLERVGLGDHLTKRQDQLSGGQRQRVALARALVGVPEVVLADEPTAALDARSGFEMISLMRDLARERATAVLIVTHDDRILPLADRILDMEDGRILSADAPARVSPADTTRHIPTRHGHTGATAPLDTASTPQDG